MRCDHPIGVTRRAVVPLACYAMPKLIAFDIATIVQEIDAMTPLLWIVSFMLVPLAFPDSVIQFLKRKWPLNVMEGNQGESRTRGFVRVIGGSLLFGSLLGLLGGCVATVAVLLQHHLSR
jgi:hypothetical protein